MSFKKSTLCLAASAGALVSASSAVSAGVFTEAAITGDSAVVSGAATVGAYNFNIPRDASYVHGANTNPFNEPQTVNGVTFVRRDFDQPTVRSTRYFSGAFNMPAGVSPSFQEVLQKQVADIDQSMVTFTGIQAGTEYLLQLFSSASGATSSTRRATGITVTSDGTTERYGGATGTWAVGGSNVSGDYFSVLAARGVQETNPAVASDWEVLYYSFTPTTNQDVKVTYLDHYAALTSAAALVVVPEPGGIALVGMAGLMALRRRRAH